MNERQQYLVVVWFFKNFYCFDKATFWGLKGAVGCWWLLSYGYRRCFGDVRIYLRESHRYSLTPLFINLKSAFSCLFYFCPSSFESLLKNKDKKKKITTITLQLHDCESVQLNESTYSNNPFFVTTYVTGVNSPPISILYLKPFSFKHNFRNYLPTYNIIMSNVKKFIKVSNHQSMYQSFLF